MLRRVTIQSPNFSGRTAPVRIVVLHTTEGARTFEELGQFFRHPSAQVSSHVGVDDTLGVVGQYVDRAHKSWSVAAFNSVSVNAEMCAFSSWTRAEWFQHENLLRNVARWISEECDVFGLPIRRLTPEQAQSGGHGVCGHVDLGAAGGGHHDPGPDFPWAWVIERAREDAAGRHA